MSRVKMKRVIAMNHENSSLEVIKRTYGIRKQKLISLVIQPSLDVHYPKKVTGSNSRRLLFLE